MAPKKAPGKAKAEAGVTIQGFCDAVKGQVVQVRKCMGGGLSLAYCGHMDMWSHANLVFMAHAE